MNIPPRAVLTDLVAASKVDGVWELKTDWGPGYRVYYALQSKRVILLCEGGDKRKQNADIKRAIKRWNEWQKRGKK